MTRDTATLHLLNLCDKGTAMIPLGYADNFVHKLFDQFEKETCPTCTHYARGYCTLHDDQCYNLGDYCGKHKKEQK